MSFVPRGVVGPSVIGIVVEPLSIPENQLDSRIGWTRGRVFLLRDSHICKDVLKSVFEELQ